MWKKVIREKKKNNKEIMIIKLKLKLKVNHKLKKYRKLFQRRRSQLKKKMKKEIRCPSMWNFKNLEYNLRLKFENFMFF